MQDIAGCRLVVPNVVAQNGVVERLKSVLPKAVVIDRRKQPSFGYRAVHIIASARNKLVEIQIRTELQDLWAQLSEKLSDVLDPAIKYGGGDCQARASLSDYSGLIASIEELDLKLFSLASSKDLEIRSSVAELTKKLAEQKRRLRQLLVEETAIWATSPRSGGGN
jgi:ppGpp synthetase/RelA/SpoT-type nucleotidyltranferase